MDHYQTLSVEFLDCPKSRLQNKILSAKLELKNEISLKLQASR
jgi:hypothetical protein